MRALLKNGEWVAIDTTYLFHDQYNTGDKRIFDRDIKRIENDARINMGRCRYCGAMVKRGEETKHFEERESRGCDKCFWYMDQPMGETKRTTRIDTVPGDNGETLKYTTVTEERVYKKACTYEEKHGGCTNTECRRMGIDWFTPENTFFLKYPGGFDSIPEVDKLETRGFVVNMRYLNATYYKKLGSYTLQAILTYTDGKETGIECYRLYNCRRDFRFRYENGELFVDQYHGLGWRKEKTLENVPYSVMKSVKAICMR